MKVGREVMGCYMETEATEEQYENRLYDKGWRKVEDQWEDEEGVDIETSFGRDW